MPNELANFSDEEYWSDPDQLSHYFYLKNKYGYVCAKEFAVKSKYFDQEPEEEIENVQDGIQEEISDQEISSSEEEYGPPLRKKYKIQETDSEDEEGYSTD